jgi:hypothetical protein
LKRAKYILVFTALLILLLTGLATYFIVEPMGAPPFIPRDENFDFQLGRGSGWHGLDLFRVTSDGTAVYEYQTESGEGWERKTFLVDRARLDALRDAINNLRIAELNRAYHGNVMDGTQWCLLISMDGQTKSVYCDNNFPAPIRNLATLVDETILEPLGSPIVAETVPQRHHRKHEKELWAAIH